MLTGGDGGRAMHSHAPRGVEKSPKLSARALTATIAAVVGSVTIGGIWLWQRWGGDATTRVVGDVACLLGAGFATVCTARAARVARSPVRRRGWWSMTAGLVAWAVGAMLWIYHESWLEGGMPLSPSLCDASRYCCSPSRPQLPCCGCRRPTAVSRGSA